MRKAYMTREEIETEVENIFADILEYEKCDDRSVSFIELGGSSFDFTKLQLEIKKRFNEKLSLKELFKNNTVIDISEIIYKRKISENAEYREDIKAEEKYKMSGMQRAVFMGRKKEMLLGGTASKTYFELVCDEYEEKRMKEAIEKTVATQQTFNTSYDDSGYAQVRNIIINDIEVIDLSALSDSEKKKRIEGIREEMFGMEFEPGSLPLYSVKISKTGDKQAVVHFVYDGLISDGEGLEILIDLIDKAYKGKELKATCRMKEYLKVLEDVHDAKEYGEALRYWRDKIPEGDVRPELPSECSESSIGKTSCQQTIRTLSFDDYKVLCDKAKNKGITPFAFLLTCFAKTVGRYSSNKRFFLNIPVSARPEECKNLENTVALCSDFTYLLFDDAATGSLAETAKTVQEELLDCRDNSVVSGTEILNLFREKNGIDNPAPVTFTSNLTDKAGNESKLLKKTYMRTNTSQTHIEMLVTEMDGKVAFLMNYEEHLISKEIAEGIADCFYDTVSAVISSDDFFEDNTAEILPDADKKIISTEAFNDDHNKRDFVCISELILSNLEKYADKPAVVWDTGLVTYGDLKKKISPIHERLLDIVKDKTHIRAAILMNKSPEQIVCVAACVTAGVSFMPLETELPGEKICECIKNINADLIITEEDYLDYFGDLRDVGIFNVTGELLSQGEKECKTENLCKAGPDDEIVIINTSGTTGTPKSIAVTQKGLSDCLLQTPELFGIEEEPTVLALTNASHDLSLFDVIGTLMYGGTIVVPDHKKRKEPAHWAELMNKFHVTVWNSVPAFMEMFMLLPEGEHKKALSDLKTVILGGDYISPSLVEKIKNETSDTEIISVGGPSETTLWNIYHKVSDEDIKDGFIPYGKPFPGTSYYIFDENMHLCPIGVTGNMFVSGIGVTKGYVCNDDETDRRFITHNGKRMYDTGDKGLYLLDGSIRIIGRNDFQVKINGKRIELAGIEQAVKSCCEVDRVSVIADGNGKLWCFYVAEKPMDESSVKEALKMHIQDYMIPYKWVYMEEMPLTSNGKTDRKVLLEMTVTHQETEKADSESEQSISKGMVSELLDVCREIMDDDDISENDDFYSMGGDSISAMKLAAMIKEKYKVQIEVFEILNNPEIESWVEMIEERK